MSTSLHPLIQARWSPQALTGEPLPRDDLLSMLEAARWAPSADNSQPWRFVYALPDGPAWPLFQALLRPVNQVWAARASALLLLCTQTQSQGRTLHAHAFDAGAACAQLALQATALGWQAHVIGGYDRQQARARLSIPAEFALQVMIAIGRSATAQPAGERRPLAELAAEGVFDFSDAASAPASRPAAA